MIPRLARELKERWEELGLPGAAPSRVSCHVSGDGGGIRGRAIVRVFRPGDPSPVALAKIPRDGGARRSVLREHDLLRELEEAAPRLAGRRFPRALLGEDHGESVLTVQTVIPGWPLERQMLRADDPERVAARLFEDARAWLFEFWRATGFLQGTGAALWEPFVRSATGYLQVFAATGQERAEVEDVVRSMESLREAGALCGYGHGTFRSGNLVSDGNATAAVDWEHGEKRQLPWVDPLSFALDVALLAGRVTGRGRVAGFLSAFLDEGPLRALTAGFLHDCYTEAGVPVEHARIALPALVLSCAHRAACGSSPDHPRATGWRELARAALLTRQEGIEPPAILSGI